MEEKITLKSMSATEILEADLERAERRKNEPFRKEWIISGVTVLPLNLILYKMKISLCLLLELIFCSMYPKKIQGDSE